ncbi:molybdenum cofactor biosynthesis prote [Aureobasidium sp. EXF-10728]|nr:molybdenum cofactor biosynthesis prote [Aureobasidium sp. EXF-10728]
MALTAFRSNRSLGPLVRGLRSPRRCVATAAATQSLSAPPALGQDGDLTLTDLTNRRQAIKQAKPFSDFLTDRYNRQHDYLRISVTERCNLRCLYCMPEEGVPLSPSSHLLTTPEIVYLSELFVSQGVTKIRLTGGEPTVRPDILPLMQQIGSLRPKGLRELALTTNAISLHRKLDKMVEAGLTGVNISLDTLDPFQFQILTRRKGYDAVMKSINRVLEMNKLGAGVKLKVNCVVMRGINERELIPFVEMGREKDIEVRFIEYMPFGGNKWSERKMLTYQEMLDIIREKYPALRTVKGHLNDTSKTYEIPGFVGKIGFITSMTHNFCGTCNRLRITSDGSLKVCLHGNTEVSLRDLLRQDNNGKPMDEQAFEAVREIEMNRRRGLSVPEPSWIERETALLNLIGEAVKRKKEKHAGMEELQNMENRPMILIGGTVSHTTALLNCQMDLYDTGADTDLVVAEGRSPRRGPGNSNFRSVGSGRLGQAVPLHLLHSNVPNSYGTRLYSSSSTSSSLPQSTEEQPAEEAQSDDTPPLSPTSTEESESEFTSLRGLFGNPRRSWSPPQPSIHEAEITDTQSGRLTQDVDATDNPFDDDTSLMNHPKDSFPSTEKEDKKAHEMLSSVPSIEAPPCHRSGHGSSLIRKTPGRSGTLIDHAVREFMKKKATEPTKATKATSNIKSPQPKPLPAWKIDPENPKQPTAAHHKKASVSSEVPVASKPLADPNADILNSIEGTSTTSPSSGEGESPNLATTLTHLTQTGEAHMVDVGAKDSTERVAVAVGFVRFSNAEPYRLITENLNKKGDVLGVARIAGIMAAKRCSDIIPLCHPIPITKITLDVGTIASGMRTVYVKGGKYGMVAVEARVHTRGQTGVEMEALTAVSGACLTVYDMCKAVDKNMVMSGSRVLYKAGGKSGDFLHDKFQDHPVTEKFLKMEDRDRKR